MFKAGKCVTALVLCMFAFGIIMSGCGSDTGKKGATDPGKQKQIVLKLGHEMPEDHPYQYGAVKFAEKVAKKTNNAIKIEIFPNGSLGKQAQLVEGVSMGTVDLCEAVTVIFEKYEPTMGVLAMPYLFRNWDHVYKVVDGPIGDELNKKLEPKGIKILAYFENGVININSRKPLKTLGDMKGIKLRVQPGPSYVELGKILGCVVTPMAYGEIYAALQMGTIDAQLQQVNNMRANKHYEVAKYYLITNTSYFLEPLAMSNDVFKRLSPAHQKALVEAAKEAAVEQREYTHQTVKKDLDFMVKQGLEVTEANQKEWQQTLAPILDKFPKWVDLIKRIQAVQ